MFNQFEPIGDENIFQEFCKDLFNYIYKTKSFQIYKTKGASQHGIDLFSTSHNIVAQSKKKKISRSDKELEKELIADFDQSLHLLKDLPFIYNSFILLSTTKRYGGVQNYAASLAQKNTFAIEFWSWEDIEPYLIKFSDLRKKYYPHLWQGDRHLPKILTYIPRIDESEIIGRSNEITELENLLDNSPKVVLVNGIGGIGKSTLAKLYVNRNEQQFSHIIWIDVLSDVIKKENEASLFINAFSNNVVLLRNLQLFFKDDTSIEEKFLLILNRLQNIQGNNLLVIDNATSEIIRFEDKLPNSKEWKVLLTSREQISKFSKFELDILTDENAKTLFYHYYNLEKDDKIIDILSYVGNHTLTIELLAKTCNKMRFTIPQLVNCLEGNGLNLSNAARVIVTHDVQKMAHKPFDYLLQIFSIADISDKQLELLRYFSVLPSIYISTADLKLLFQISSEDNEFFENISELVIKGWIKEENGNYQVHQIIQEVLREKLKPDASNCAILINGISKIIDFSYKENFISKLPYLAFAEKILLHLYDKQNEFITLMNNVAVINDYNGNITTAIKLNEEILDIKSKQNNIADDINVTYINLAVSWLRLGEYNKALQYNIKNIAYLEGRNDKKESLELAMSYNNIAENYRHLGDINKSLNYNNKAIKIFESSNAGQEHPELATVYNNLSNSYGEISDRRMSLKYGLKATEIREKLLDKDHPYLAQSYNNLGVDYEKLGDFKKSLEYHNNAINIRERIYKADHYDLAESYNNIAELFRAKGDFNAAINYHYKSIEIRETIFLPSHPEIGTAYGNLAGVFLHKKDYKNAKKYYDKAIELKVQGDSKNNSSLAIIYFNYSVLNFNIGDLLNAKTYIDKSILIFKQMSSKSNPNLKLALQLKKTIDKGNIKPVPIIKNDTEKKTGRNEMCFCGSSKKYKFCCGKN